MRVGLETINLDTKAIEDEPYTLSFEDVKYENIDGGYDYRILAEYLLSNKYQDDHIIIHTNEKNNKALERLLTKFNITYEFNRASNYTYRGPGVIIFNDKDDLNYSFSTKNNYKLLDLYDFDGYGALVSMIINSYNVFDYERSSYTESFIKSYMEERDSLYKFLNENFVVDQSSFVLLQDLFDSFNSWMLNKGEAKVSMRFFIESLQVNNFFLDNKLIYKKSTRVLNSLSHSKWIDDEGNEVSSRKITPRVSYIIGLKYK